MTAVDVTCEPAGDGWRCRVSVADDRGASTHDVGVPRTGPHADAMPPVPTTADVEGLVRETFAFLLEREPRTSILARFELPVVARYFPDYPDAIRIRLSR